MNYFGYGSNMNLQHLQAWIRSQSGDPTDIRNPRQAHLHHYRLRTNYRSARHGAGAANIEPVSGQVVEGVLMSVTPALREVLRHKEGWPHIYEEINVTVVAADSGDPVEAFTYIVTESLRLPSDQPVTPQYAQLILDAAAQFNFSAAYQGNLRQLLQTPAPGTTRFARPD